MTDRLRISGDAIITEDESTGDVTLDLEAIETERQSTGPGLVLATYPEDFDDPNSDRIEEPFGTIQGALDALPTNDQGRTCGGIEVMGRGSSDAETRYNISESITIDGRLILRGQGTNTKISTTGGIADPAIDITAGDDVEIEHIWVDNPWSNNTTDGDAIRSTISELILNRVNVDNAGRYAINMDGPRNTMKQCEIKDGDKAAIRLGGSCFENKIENTIIHDELGKGIPVAIEADRVKTLMLNNVFIMLDDATTVVDYTDANTGDYWTWSNVYIGPSLDSNANGQVSNDLDLRGDNSQYSGVIVRNMGLDLSNATETIFYGFVDGGITHGTRTVVNGWSVNSGNPTSGGDWNGNAEYAAKHGAIVYDTSGTSPLPRYSAQPDGAGGYEWVEESVSAA